MDVGAGEEQQQDTLGSLPEGMRILPEPGAFCHPGQGRVTGRQHQKGPFPPTPGILSAGIPLAKLGFVLTGATLRASEAAVFVWL